MARGSTSAALGAGLASVAGEGRMVLAGAGVGIARTVLTVPATAFAVAVAWTGARFALSGGASPGEAAQAALVSLASPRALSIAVGLWLAGLLLWGALRMAWVAGACPVLAWRLAGRPGPAPRLRDGMVERLGPVLVTGALALLLDLAASGMVASTAFGALTLVGRTRAAPGAAAFVAATAVSAALFLGALLVALGEVAIARAALAGETAASALGGAVRAALRRPAALVLAVLTVGVSGAVAAVAVQGMLGAMLGAGPAPGWLLLPAQALSGLLAGVVAAGAELWRLAALGAIALGDQEPRPEIRSSSLRTDSLGMRPPSQ